MRLVLQLFTCCLLLVSAATLAKSSVWKAQKQGQVLYLGGTVHLLTKQDFPLPREFTHAYEVADTIVFEIDIDELSDPKLQQQMLEIQLLSEGTIFDVINDKTQQDLTGFFTSRGLDFKQLQRYKPGFIAMTMHMQALRSIGFTQEGVDQYFFNLAGKDGKPRQYLETAIQQIKMLAGMGVGYENDFFQFTLRDINNIELEITPLVTAWRSGDINELKNLSLAEMEKDFPKVYQQLVVDRNHKWLQKLQAMAQTKEIEFVLGGVLHFPGQDGILNLLQQQGFTITQVHL
ncbi:MAG: TraB/GumN family protein [Aestuariibacter sp.]